MRANKLSPVRFKMVFDESKIFVVVETLQLIRRETSRPFDVMSDWAMILNTASCTPNKPIHLIFGYLSDAA